MNAQPPRQRWTEPKLRMAERFNLAVGRAINRSRTGRAAQDVFLRGVGYAWMRWALSTHMLVDGIDGFRALNPDKGVLLVTNHRSFFDLYAVSVAFFAARTKWIDRLAFPVKADFFYQRPLGLVTNLAAGGGVMYPPFWRDRARARLNRESLTELVDMLSRKGWIVGFHPEGTRGKGADPYELLPMQPGAGELALKSDALVVPVFIGGLSNNVLSEVRKGFSRNARQDPCICVFGEPIDLSDLRAERPGAATYSRAGERFRDAILALAEREKALRADNAAGAIASADRRWIANFPGGRFYARR
jgi:1-acyl-sn-glycerol-3-phosphate acyltransferase